MFKYQLIIKLKLKHFKTKNSQTQLYLCKNALTFSPTVITLTSLPAGSSDIWFLTSLPILEWRAPQRPRSEEIATNKSGPSLASGVSTLALS